MPQGKLVKITANRKLMIKIDEETYEKLRGRIITALTQNKFPSDRLATFELENDDGEMNKFVMITLDKYDKQLLERKFEPLLKKPIIFQCRTKAYDFTSNDEQIRGVCLELTSICLDKKKAQEVDVESLCDSSRVENKEDDLPAGPPELVRQ